MGDQNQSQNELVTACNGSIQNPENFPSAIYQGKRVYFCTRACLRVFEQSPDAFMRGEVEHPLDED
ncbi:MAG: hypothetical protein CVU39_07365 [Chloroflexi bacterium HGW-Chloroflexi-10]|nr:MAG: hypothetical protein CVU39_07365 [Chloroflexi bacterium HGW-Chloroflexi-10]